MYLTRNAELVVGLLDQAVILYASFVGGLLCVVGVVMYSWMSTKGECYAWSFAATLELLWTLIPVAFLLFCTMHSLGVLYAMDSTRSSCSTWVSVIGHQWYWEYTMEMNQVVQDSRLVPSSSLSSGMPRVSTVDSVLFLPVNVVSGVSITSVDVLHSWSVPCLGIKLDAVPGRSSLCSILPRTSGVVGGYCAELCGVGHAFMPILVCCYRASVRLRPQGFPSVPFPALSFGFSRTVEAEGSQRPERRINELVRDGKGGEKEGSEWGREKERKERRRGRREKGRKERGCWKGSGNWKSNVWKVERKERKCGNGGRNGMGKRGMVGKWERNGKEGREKASGDKVWEEKLELEGKRKEGKEQGGKLGMLTIRIRWLELGS